MRRILFFLLIANFGMAQCPTAPATQNFCSGQNPTIASLQATNNGSGIAWYPNSSGGTPLNGGTALSTGTYYLDDASGSCSRSAVNVTLYATPVANTPYDLQSCTGTTFATFFLPQNSPVILGSQPASQFTVTYFTSLANATNNVSPISNPGSYSAVNNTTIYARVRNNLATSCYAITSFVLHVYAMPQVDTPADVSQCGAYQLPALTHGNYFSELNGEGTPYFAGDLVTQSMTMYVFSFPDAPDGCSANSSFDITIDPGTTYYADADGDGYGDAANTLHSCTGVPPGYVLDASDCDDTQVLYADADNDGFGSLTPAACGVPDSTDCDDADASKHTTYTFFLDGDFDTYGGSSQGVACAVDALTAPYGYSVNNQDCNDGIAAIHPGHPEVYYNGVDDDCDGQLDEGAQLTTQVIAAQCGATLASINSVIQVNGVTNATKYRYRVYKLVGGVPSGAPMYVERAQPYFTLTNLSSYEYATTYRIDAEVQRNNIWLGYFGPICDVSSPAILDTGGAGAVNPSQCGSQLATISSLIYTTSLNGVTGYRFKVTNLSDPYAPNQVQTIDRSVQWFALTMLANYNYGTTYRIEVAVKTTGAYGGFGQGCDIITPNVPMITSCDVHLSQPTTYVYTASMNKATSYRFEVSLVDENDFPIATQYVERTLQYFNFMMVPGYVPGGKYMVRTAIRTAGWHSPYGEACFVYAPVSARQDGTQVQEAPASLFQATVFPNPYSESFMLNLETTAPDPVSIRVYDLTGKLLDDRLFAGNQLELETFGTRYPSGVYTVVVTQGVNVKTLRVIKR